MKQFTTVPILVGGPSGIGKSSIINDILSMNDLFVRPKSFTTRTKRPNENDHEYDFISEAEYLLLKSQSKFINDDTVYNNHYASSKSSIDNILKTNKFPIKEIHPNNFWKFKKIYSNLLTVLIMPTDFYAVPKKDGDIDRYESDIAFYKNIDTNDFDIIVYNDFITSIHEISSFLFNTIFSLIINDSIFPRPSVIDNFNKNGYNKVAEEFSDDKRLTTNNFHILSKNFFSNAINKFVKNNDKLLEIGPGQNWILNNFNFPEIRYNAIDISTEMSRFNNVPMKFRSIRDTGYAFNDFDIIIASLADPYFFPSAICEIWRILKPNGYFIFSIPSSKWSTGIRNVSNKTKFQLENGTEAEVYSFTFTLDEIKLILENCSFEIIYEEEQNASPLLLDGIRISPILIKASQINKIDIKDLILLNQLILKKIL